MDIARIIRAIPAAVICEIMNDDGTMARKDDLIKFANKYNLKIADINSLLRYRIENAL